MTVHINFKMADMVHQNKKKTTKLNDSETVQSFLNIIFGVNTQSTMYQVPTKLHNRSFDFLTMYHTVKTCILKVYK